MISIRVDGQDFDPATQIAALEALGGGAVASFTGIVRGDGGLVSLTLDHYPAMTQTQIARLVEDARVRWPLLGISIWHRVGTLHPGERIVFVGTASAHRQAALESCTFLIDWLKSAAPFWKKEVFSHGESRWVDSREGDADSLKRWQD